MTVQIALFRAVNVGGNAKLPMADLRSLAQSIGFKSVSTLLQSGNLIFEAGAKTPEASRKLLQAACANTFALKNDIYVRTAADLAKIVADNPFPAEARDDPGHLAVLFLRSAPDAKAFETLQAVVKGREIIRAGAHDAYITYPDGMGESKLTLALIEKRLGVTGTMRNWNTVLKLASF